jgi:hypothetical protein
MEKSNNFPPCGSPHTGNNTILNDAPVSPMRSRVSQGNNSYCSASTPTRAKYGNEGNTVMQSPFPEVDAPRTPVREQTVLTSYTYEPQSPWGAADEAHEGGRFPDGGELNTVLHAALYKCCDTEKLKS